MREHNTLMARWKKDIAFKATYDKLEDEFYYLMKLLAARKKASLTQAQVTGKSHFKMRT